MRWLWIGDSHLEAMHSQIRDLSAARGAGGLLSYRRGWSSGRWLRDGDVPALVARAQPDVVAFLLGTNDDPPNADAVRGLAQTARNARVVWFGPFHSPAHDDLFRSVLDGAFVSGAALAKDLPFQSGGNVHLTAAGYAALAPRLVEMMLPQQSWKVGLAVVGGCVLAALGLVALGGSRIFEEAA